MSALNRKLFRDLWRMKGQVFAILLVIASGVATAIMSISTHDSLRLTRAAFYRDYRFADRSEEHTSELQSRLGKFLISY